MLDIQIEDEACHHLYLRLQIPASLKIILLEIFCVLPPEGNATR
jgi:hypothetical protein